MAGREGVAASITTVLILVVVFVVMLFGIVQLSKSWKQNLINKLKSALKRRKIRNDTFRKENGYSWDFVVAFKVYDEDDPVSELQMTHNMKKILDQLSAGGLEVRLFYSLQCKEVFCKIRAPLVRLQKHADLVDYLLPFEPAALRALCETGREDLWAPLRIPEKSDLTSLGPYEFIFGRYELDTSGPAPRTRPDLCGIYKRWPQWDAEQCLQALERGEEVNEALALSQTQTRAQPAVSVTSAEVPLTKNPLASSVHSSDSNSPNAQDTQAVTLNPEAAMFRSVDRIKLMHMIMSSHTPGGCHLDPYRLLKDRCILAYSPLHDMVELRALESEWITFIAWPWTQPLERIKNYFGEKIGMYFAFLGMYTTWLIPASIVGFGVWINVAIDDNNASATSVPYFAGFIGLWSALFLESWKRKQFTLSMQWGTADFEENEQPRPEFKGESVRSSVTGQSTLYFPRRTRLLRGFFSQTIVGSMVCVVIAVIAAIFSVRVAIASARVTALGIDIASVVASILLALQIQFLNGFFGSIALRLNNYENHRTNTEYENALIAKTFAFQFVNSFASLFYIAFVKPFIPSIDPCQPGGNCMDQLQTTLGTIFLTRIVVGNLTEVGLPLVSALLERRRRRNEYTQEVRRTIAERSRLSAENLERLPSLHSMDGLELSMYNRKQDESFATEEKEMLKKEMSEIEKLFTMPEYHVMLGPFEDYAEMVIQFGYTTMFVAAFPLALLLSFVNNYVEIRVDAWKLCHVFRRPEPRSCENIGTWYDILEVVSSAAIFINSALVAFTGTNTQNYRWVDRVWIFILMACGLFAIRQTVAWLIPDLPAEVQIQLDRQRYIAEKVLDNVQDEDDTDLAKNNFGVPSYLVKGTDDDPM